ncbi:MAG: hypothetical protein C0631_09400 [Sedimenticola sp.]|nr:MAG: hypothetical protein C0631_09400 [Sedimenticola sp.]
MLPSGFKLYIRNRLFFPFIASFPRRISYKLATLKGMLDTIADSPVVTAAVKGVMNAFPKMDLSSARTIIKSQRGMLSRERLDVYWLDRINSKNIDQFIRLEGLENLTNSITSEQPVILYSAHFGRLIMPSMAIGAMGISTSCLTADISNPDIPDEERRYLSKKLKSMERLMGGDMIQKNDSLRRLYNVLKKKGVLIVIVDAPPAPEDSTEVFPFLGGKARLSTGVIKIAKKMNALLVPYFAQEEREGLVGYFLPAFSVQKLDDDEALAKVFEPVEQFIRKRPDQWWMWHALPVIWRKS